MSQNTPHVSSIPDSKYSPSIPAQRLETAFRSLVNLLHEPLPDNADHVSTIQARYYALRSAYYTYLNLVSRNQRAKWAKEGMCFDPNPSNAPKDLEGLRKFRNRVRKELRALTVFDDLMAELKTTKLEEEQNLKKDIEGPDSAKEEDEEEDEGGEVGDETDNDEGGVKLEVGGDHDQGSVKSENGLDHGEGDDPKSGSDESGKPEDGGHQIEVSSSDNDSKITVIRWQILPRPGEAANDNNDSNDNGSR